MNRSNSVRFEESSFVHVYLDILKKLLKHKHVDKELRYGIAERENKWYMLYTLLYKSDSEYDVPKAVYYYLLAKAKQKFKYLK
jgi:hypothetical protein